MSEFSRLVESNFELGQLVCTRGVADKMKEDVQFRKFVGESFNKYTKCDWGDTCSKDAKMNDEAVIYIDRILAVYISKKINVTIWIITEQDRSITTILFPSEY
jgi:hypothetical protein